MKNSLGYTSSRENLSTKTSSTSHQPKSLRNLDKTKTHLPDVSLDNTKQNFPELDNLSKILFFDIIFRLKRTRPSKL